MNSPKVAAVVPTCRGFSVPEQTIPVSWYVVHDREEIEDSARATNIRDFDRELYGDRCDSIRSVGFLRAAQDGADFILTVDDDCELPLDWAESHVRALQHPEPLWAKTCPFATRGLPKDPLFQPVAISHGLWAGVPDLDAEMQLAHKPGAFNGIIKHGQPWNRISAPFPQSAMNFGFNVEVLPAMYQPAQGVRTCFDRFADIWGGLFAQRVLSLHGYEFKNGGAVVQHNRASDPKTNLEKEAPGKDAHEVLWPYVWSFGLVGSNLATTYRNLAAHVGAFQRGGSEWQRYWTRLARNMQKWADLTESTLR